MARKTAPTLTSQQRLRRGLHYTAVGPVDVTRGVVGLTAHSAESAAAAVRRRYRDTRAARRELMQDAAAVKQVVAELPAAIQEARSAPRRRRRLLVFGGLGLATVVGGAVAFTIVRRSMQPEPSALPPSIEVSPKP